MTVREILGDQIELFRLSYGLPEVKEWIRSKDYLAIRFEDAGYVEHPERIRVWLRGKGCADVSTTEEAITWLADRGLDIRSEPERQGLPKPDERIRGNVTVMWIWNTQVGRLEFWRRPRQGTWQVLLSPLCNFAKAIDLEFKTQQEAIDMVGRILGVRTPDSE
jgi:hypothetical protein